MSSIALKETLLIRHSSYHVDSLVSMVFHFTKNLKLASSPYSTLLLGSFTISPTSSMPIVVNARGIFILRTLSTMAEFAQNELLYDKAMLWLDRCAWILRVWQHHSSENQLWWWIEAQQGLIFQKIPLDVLALSIRMHIPESSRHFTHITSFEFQIPKATTPNSFEQGWQPRWIRRQQILHTTLSSDSYSTFLSQMAQEVLNTQQGHTQLLSDEMSVLNWAVRHLLWQALGQLGQQITTPDSLHQKQYSSFRGEKFRKDSSLVGYRRLTSMSTQGFGSEFRPSCAENIFIITKQVFGLLSTSLRHDMTQQSRTRKLNVTRAYFFQRTTGLKQQSMLSKLGKVVRTFCTRKSVELGQFSSKQERSYTDQVRLKVRGGNGGDGARTFLKDKYRIRGPPDGGCGGNGADVILQSNTGLSDLRHFKTRNLAGANGVSGGIKGRDGKAGGKKVVQVPIGTLVYQIRTNEQGDQKQQFVADMDSNKQHLVVARGGKGGKGNKNHPMSSGEQKDGQKGELKTLRLQLKSLADVGLLGLPNIGKSTFLASVSRALPKIADYEFTTLKPSIGCITFVDGKQIRVADIPGIIQKAHENKGLGLQFLKHLERTKILIFMIDITRSDPFQQLRILKSEITQYKTTFLEGRKYLIVLNKIDKIQGGQQIVRQIGRQMEEKVFGISAKFGDGVGEVVCELRRLLYEQ